MVDFVPALYLCIHVYPLSLSLSLSRTHTHMCTCVCICTLIQVDRIRAHRKHTNMKPRQGFTDQDLAEATKHNYAEQDLVVEQRAARWKQEQDVRLRQDKLQQMLAAFDGVPITPEDWEEFELSHAEDREHRRIADMQFLAREQFVNQLHRLQLPVNAPATQAANARVRQREAARREQHSIVGLDGGDTYHAHVPAYTPCMHA